MPRSRSKSLKKNRKTSKRISKKSYTKAYKIVRKWFTPAQIAKMRTETKGFSSKQIERYIQSKFPFLISKSRSRSLGNSLSGGSSLRSIATSLLVLFGIQQTNDSLNDSILKEKDPNNIRYQLMIYKENDLDRWNFLKNYYKNNEALKQYVLEDIVANQDYDYIKNLKQKKIVYDTSTKNLLKNVDLYNDDTFTFK
jgi:hypothetical protein